MRVMLLSIENDGVESLIRFIRDRRPEGRVRRRRGMPPADLPPGIPQALGLARELTVRARATAVRGTNNVNGGATVTCSKRSSPPSEFCNRNLIWPF